MNPIDHALLAVLASVAGDTTDAQEHLGAARVQARATARRDRQVVEIAGLVVAGARDRAQGLALVHTAEFPHDRELLAHVLRNEPQREVQR